MILLQICVHERTKLQNTEWTSFYCEKNWEEGKKLPKFLLPHKLYSALESIKAWIDGSLPRKSDRASIGSFAPPGAKTCHIR